MPLAKPALTAAAPGQPITAQAWNALTGAIDALYDAVNALGGGVIQVQVAADGQAVAAAQVLAVPQGSSRALTAVPPYPGVVHHTVAGVTDGTWTLHVRAPGYVAQAINVAVPVAAPVVVNLVKDGVDMPDLFGMPASQALGQLKARGIQIEHIVDTHGDELPTLNLPASHANQPVLMHWPPATAVVRTATERARLVVAADAGQTSTAVVPNLSGLTLGEAVKALESVGLKVGRTIIKT